MDALDPAERMPRQQRRAREAAFREVIEQAHQDQQQREQQQEHSQCDANRREPQTASSSSAHHPTHRGGSAHSSKSRTSQSHRLTTPAAAAAAAKQAANAKQHCRARSGLEPISQAAVRNQSQQQRTYSEVAAGQSGSSQQRAPATPSGNKWRHVTHRHVGKFQHVTKRSDARLERQRQTAKLGCHGDDTSAAEADSQATPATTQTERDNPSYDGDGAGSGQASRPANFTQPSKAKKST